MKIHGACVGGKIKPLYNVWQTMKQRCLLPTNKVYKAYGGRGISVCDEWLDYIAFEKWAESAGYILGLTLERKDVNGNYCPENCIWADWETQYNNTRKAKKHLYKGELLTSRQLSQLSGLSGKLISERINKLGWSVEDAVTRKPNPGLSPFPYKQRSHS